MIKECQLVTEHKIKQLMKGHIVNNWKTSYFDTLLSETREV